MNSPPSSTPQELADPQSHRSKSRFFIALLFVAAVGLRLAAARGELSFDEVWSWQLAARSQSAWDILELRLDNNHILNTLVIYGIGPLAEPILYRLPAVVAASAGLIFGYLLARRRKAGGPVLALLAGSHILILYGSEARGYAYLTGCTLAAWWAIEEFVDRPRLWSLALFGVSCVLGFASQLPFAFAYSGFFVYSVLCLARQRKGGQNLVFLHVVPILAVIAVYLFYVDGMVRSGGDRFPLGRTVGATLSLWAGGPQLVPVAYGAAGVAIVVLAVSLVGEFRFSPARGMMYLTAMFLVPAGVIAISQFEFVYPRHFLIPMIFGYVAVGCQLARWSTQGRVGRVVAGGLIVLFWGANAIPVGRLLSATRTQDAAAFSWVVDHADSSIITISGDHDFRVFTPLEFFMFRHDADFLKRGIELRYFDRSKSPPVGTDWKLLHTASDWESAPPHDIQDSFGNGYKQVQVFPASSLSAFSWFIYRRVETPSE